MRPVIQVEQLSKHYRLGLIGGGTLREDLHRWWAKARGRPDPLLKIGQEDHGNREGGELWALRDVSFQVQEGEILGIIGRNGAGKSTLLKILSRITAPTTGQVKIRGRVGSLLEVGTGFHPELTGRENIYLNGAILGMKKTEIGRKLDEIIDFAEIEQFIDTPVKRYSSGMYVRLAFAVAAHLEPEILIVDEVLAVGDDQFQKKCLGKMDDIANNRSATVLFVSHNMAAIKTLTKKSILIKSGTIKAIGPSGEVVQEYLAFGQDNGAQPLHERIDRKGDGRLRYNKVNFLDKCGHEVSEVISGDAMTIQCQYQISEDLDPANLIIAMSLWDQFRNPVALFASDEMGLRFSSMSNQGAIRIEIPRLLLRSGRYSLKLQASHLSTAPEDFCDVIEDAAFLNVIPGDFWKSGCTNRGGNFSIMDAEIRICPAS